MPVKLWKPGESGNPSGRPAGFRHVARKILAETEGGAELVQYALDIWRDPLQPQMRRDAMHTWLSDRGLGRPVQMTELAAHISGDAPLAISDGMTREQLVEAIAARRALLVSATGATVLELPAGEESSPIVLDSVESDSQGDSET